MAYTAARRSALLYDSFSQEDNSWKILPLQTIAAHSYMAILVRGGGGVIPLK